ncbi:hypothetical protein FRB94_005112 [Tulasnella sp. JGI-2019a]|nr:hypothetical protein FRB94_005112 [Tulasnella sp. JGI-2019a]
MTAIASGSNRLRSPSPAIFASIQHGNDKDLDSRVYASSMATTWEELAQTIPTAYRPVAATLLKRLHDLAVKVSNVEGTVNSLIMARDHEGTLPPQVQGLHEPRWAVSKEFSPHAADAQANMHTTWLAARSAALAEGIALKEAELAWLEKQLTTEEYWPECHAQLRGVFDGLVKRYRIPEEAGTDADSGKVKFVYKTPTSLGGEYAKAKDMVAMCSTRVIEIEKSKSLAIKLKEARKEKAKQAADVAMAGDSDDDMDDGDEPTVASLAKKLSELKKEFKVLG